MASYGQPYPYGQMQQPIYQPRQDFSVNQYGAPQPAPQPAVQPMQSGFETRPVTSREEALGVQVDFLGPGTVMPDLGHGMIYLKRFNQNTGASDLLEFAYQPPRQAQPEQQYVTVEMFKALEDKVAELQKPVTSKKSAKEKDIDADE